MSGVEGHVESEAERAVKIDYSRQTFLIKLSKVQPRASAVLFDFRPIPHHRHITVGFRRQGDLLHATWSSHATLPVRDARHPYRLIE